MHLIAAPCVIGKWGGRGKGKAVGPPGKSPPSPPDTSPFSIFPTPKNNVAEDAFNNIFLLKKIQQQALHLSIHLALPCPELRQKGNYEEGPGQGSALGAVGLLLLKQSHGELGTAPQPLQVAEAAAVVELLAEPRAAVAQGELLHQPWLHGPEEVEP